MATAHPKKLRLPAAKKASKQAILRAVASSTAIETGQGIGQIERMLREKRSKYRKLALAN